MEKDHFLKDFVSGDPKFISEPWYNPYGDCITYQIADEAVVARRIDELLTIYESAISEKPIGFQIKGVGAIVRKFGFHGIQIECTEADKEILKVSLSAILLTAYEEGPKTIGRRTAYAEAIDFSPRQTSLEISPVNF